MDRPRGARRQWRARLKPRHVFRIEIALAKASLTRVERRDPHKVFHRMTPAELQAIAPGSLEALHRLDRRRTSARPLGEVFVRKNFSPEVKGRANAMVAIQGQTRIVGKNT